MLAMAEDGTPYRRDFETITARALTIAAAHDPCGPSLMNTSFSDPPQLPRMANNLSQAHWVDTVRLSTLLGLSSFGLIGPPSCSVFPVEQENVGVVQGIFV